MDSDKDLILNYLGQNQPFNFRGTQRYSTLITGLRECRVLTKRDVLTGQFNPELKEGNEGSWLGTIGYFTILDQIGSCFKLIGEPNPIKNKNKIQYAIEKFAYDLIDTNEYQLNALIALRNAFTHDFNLLNIPTNGNKQQIHKFTVLANPREKWVVKLPNRQWDKNIDGKDFLDTSNTTFVNLFGVGQLTEIIYSRICNLLKNNKLQMVMPTIMLINKYTFVISDIR